MFRKILIGISIIVPILCMLIIFGFSSQNNFDTYSLSISFTESVSKKIFSNYDFLDDSTKNDIIYGLNLFIRKMAHFTLYFILGFFSFLSISTITKKYRKSAFFSTLICTIYAGSDELHQMNVQGRTPLLKDVLIDTIGGLCGILFCFLIISAFINIKNRLSNNNSSQ